MTDAERIAMNRLLLTVGERICKCCLRRLALGNYSSSITDGQRYYAATCKPCNALISAARYQDNRRWNKRVKASAQSYYRRNKEKVLERQRQRRARQRQASYAPTQGVKS